MDNFEFNQYNLGIFECERKNFELNGVEARIILDKVETFINGCLSQLPNIKQNMNELINKLENIKYKLEDSSSIISNGYKGNIDLKLQQLEQDKNNVKEQIIKCENILNQLPITEDNLININEIIKLAKAKIQENSS